jgi:hypothetical protein
MANIGQGTYSLRCPPQYHIVKNYEWRDLAIVFNVINFDKDAFVGTAWIPPVVRYIMSDDFYRVLRWLPWFRELIKDRPAVYLRL